MKYHFFLLSIFCFAFKPCYVQSESMQNKRSTQLIEVHERTNEKTIVQQKRVSFQNLKGLIISGDREVPPYYVMNKTKGVEFYRSMQSIPLKARTAFQKYLYRLVIGRTLTFENLETLKKKISAFCQMHGQPFVVVNILEKNMADGILVITVLDARAGKISIEGNLWRNEQFYRDRICLKENTPIYYQSLEEDLSWLNCFPWCSTSAIIHASDDYGMTDIDIIVEDRRPFEFYVGADNTGFRLIDYNRVFTGLSCGDILDSNWNFDYQYRASPDFTTYQSHLLECSFYLPWRDILSLNGEIANMHEGKSYQLNLRNIFPLSQMAYMQQELRVGWDWKRSNNDLIVGESSIIDTFATVFQVACEYNISLKGKSQFFDMHASIVTQPWNWGKSMSHSTYDLLRSNADNNYIYVAFRGEYLWQEPKYQVGLRLKTTAQVSSGALIPLEMFGLGGFDNVRGYENRAVNVDNGIIFNIELSSPQIPLLEKIKSTKKIDESLRLIAFFDIGKGSLNKIVSYEPQNYLLAGVGPGIRYHVDQYIQASLDWGFRLTPPPNTPEINARSLLYFSVLAIY